MSSADWLRIARAYVALAAVRLLLLRRSYPAVVLALEPRRPPPPAAFDVVVVARLAAAVDIAARYGLPPATCLPRALALYHLLRTHGWPAEVRIGVRRSAAGLLAHAWVESAGRVVGDAPDVAEAYRPLAPYAPLPPEARPGEVVTIAGARRRKRALRTTPKPPLVPGRP